MQYTWSVIPFSSPDFNIITRQYQKLIELKKGLFIDEEESVNEDMVFEIVKKRTVEDFFFLNAFIADLKRVPEQVLFQYQKIINSYTCREIYEENIKETEILFQTDREFKDFLKHLKRHLSISDSNDYRLINSFIYELCRKYINDYVTILPQKFYLNFHLLYKWMLECSLHSVPKLSALENTILTKLADGGWTVNHINRTVLDCSEDDEFIQAVIHQILPAKFGVNSITQVIGFLYFKNCKITNILKIDNSFEAFKK